MAASVTARREWTTPADIRRTLRRRWEQGTFLGMFAAGQQWVPLSLGLHGPAASEIASRFADVQAWVSMWERADGSELRVERKNVGGRLIGSNAIPSRVWVDSYQQLWQYLDVAYLVDSFGTALDETKAAAPVLAGWMLARPMRVLALAADWARLVSTVLWIQRSASPGTYLRQIDVPGVDTKFIERHRGILTELLDLQLSEDQVDHAQPRSDFAARYRFRKKPGYIRFRMPRGLATGRSAPGATEDGGLWLGECSEITVRADELVTPPPGISTAYLIENEITYLAFPVPVRSLVIFGSGYGIAVLKSLTWLANCKVNYWGDIDTHGFAILSRLRQAFPHARSMLMDRATLLAHESQWVKEPSQVVADLECLHPDEADLYRDLLEDALGPSVRLEQERVSFGAIEHAVQRECALPMTGAGPAASAAVGIGSRRFWGTRQ